MRRTRTLTAGLAVAALALTACGEPEETGEVDGQESAALEDEIAELRVENEQLRDENEQLRVENERLREETDGEAPEETDEAPEQAPTEPTGEPAPIHSREGLNQQLRTLFEPPAGTPEEWEPGTTDWRSAEAPEGLADSYETLGELALDLAAALGGPDVGRDTWETTIRALPDDDDPELGFVAVLSYGFKDDSVAGHDVRMTVIGGDGAWSPGGMEERFHCRRGVSDDLCV